MFSSFDEIMLVEEKPNIYVFRLISACSLDIYFQEHFTSIILVHNIVPNVSDLRFK